VIEAIKDLARQSTGLPDPALHALIGLAAYLLAVALFRRSFRNLFPWFVALGLQLINETADMARDLSRYGDIDVRGTLGDTIVTMFLPTIILLIARLRAREPLKESN
jgi:hypothetical protein